MIDQSTKSTAETIVCPLCWADIGHQQLGSQEENVEYSEATHCWVCNQCAFIGFEFNHDKDVDRISCRLLSLNNYTTLAIANDLIRDDNFAQWVEDLAEDFRDRELSET